MQIKTILILCLIFVGIINSAENKGDGSTFVAPSYSDFIGKKYVKIKEIDPALSVGQFSALYQDENYAVSIYGNDKCLNKWKNARFNYLFFTKKIGQQGSHPVKQILDIVFVDMDTFGDSVSFWLDDCNCQDQKDCQIAAIYYRDEKKIRKGIKVKPFKAWQPNIATGKLEELSPAKVRCGPQAPEEEQ